LLVASRGRGGNISLPLRKFPLDAWVFAENSLPRQ
jgi:hypothetical protein